MACFQAAYNYLDMLTELPSTDPAVNGQLLHRALLVALDPDAQHLDYYEHHHLHDDGGYLVETVEECRAALAAAALLRRRRARRASRRRADRGVSELQHRRGPGRLSRARTLGARAHAVRERPALVGDGRLRRLLAGHLRADRGGGAPACAPAEIAAIEGAYFPWIGALHSLLDNLVDIAEDYATGQRSLVGCYASSLDAATRMRLLAERSLRAARGLPDSRGHVLVLAAMASFYLSTPEAAAPAARPVAHAVLDALGEPARLSMLVFRSRLRAAAPRAARARRAGAARKRRRGRAARRGRGGRARRCSRRSPRRPHAAPDHMA